MIALFSAFFIGELIWQFRPKIDAVLHHNLVRLFCVLVAGFTWLVGSDIVINPLLIQSMTMGLYATAAWYCVAFVNKKAWWISKRHLSIV